MLGRGEGGTWASRRALVGRWRAATCVMPPRALRHIHRFLSSSRLLYRSLIRFREARSRPEPRMQMGEAFLRLKPPHAAASPDSPWQTHTPNTHLEGISYWLIQNITDAVKSWARLIIKLQIYVSDQSDEGYFYHRYFSFRKIKTVILWYAKRILQKLTSKCKYSERYHNHYTLWPFLRFR